jgi:hypothetical protein
MKREIEAEVARVTSQNKPYYLGNEFKIVCFKKVPMDEKHFYSEYDVVKCGIDKNEYTVKTAECKSMNYYLKKMGFKWVRGWERPQYKLDRNKYYIVPVDAEKVKLAERKMKLRDVLDMD